MNVLAVLSIFASRFHVQPAHAAVRNRHNIVECSAAVFLKLLNESCSKRQSVVFNDRKLRSVIVQCDVDLASCWDVRGKEGHRWRGECGRVTAVAAAGHNAGLLLSESGHIVTIDVYLMASLLCVATTSLEQAAEGEIFVAEGSLEPLVAAFGWKCFVYGDLELSGAEGGVDDRDKLHNVGNTAAEARRHEGCGIVVVVLIVARHFFFWLMCGVLMRFGFCLVGFLFVELRDFQ